MASSSPSRHFFGTVFWEMIRNGVPEGIIRKNNFFGPVGQLTLPMAPYIIVILAEKSSKLALGKVRESLSTLWRVQSSSGFLARSLLQAPVLPCPRNNNILYYIHLHVVSVCRLHVVSVCRLHVVSVCRLHVVSVYHEK